MRAFMFALVAAVLLTGFSPGLVLNLYNGTDDVLHVTNPPFRRVVTIPPNTAQDVAIAGNVLIRSSLHSWKYSSRSLLPPTSLFQQHTMLWRAFGKIDRHGEIYLFGPPPDHGRPQKIPQPHGFPVKPQ
jgi:hypothetical protein